MQPELGTRQSGGKRPLSSKHTLCMVSDFFYPNTGGVEMHIWSLAQCLIRRGHKAIVVTHAYGDRQGVRHMSNGLKVYYLPLGVVYDQIIFPTLYAFFPIFRNILIREGVTIVHGHQSTSPMTNECLLYARAMGYKVCYTDHSIFGFDDMASIHVNKILQVTLSNIDHAICVSHTCRENLCLRAGLHPSQISTIPNAIDASKFLPDPSRRHPLNTVNIVLLSRLVYRKGIDILVKVIPILCSRVPSVHFIIGGDGPKRLILEEMRERFQLHDRVELLGAVMHSNVRDVLVRGQIFLNCSLTESFCIALLEAASCGLFVVSTSVGGVPEVLPPSMIKFASPDPASIVDALIEAISVSRKLMPSELHEKMRFMYSWTDVAKRTEVVYNYVSASKTPTLLQRLLRYRSVGPWAGVGACVIAVALHFLWLLCDYIWPSKNIEKCPDFPWVRKSRLKSRYSSAGDPVGRSHLGKSARDSYRYALTNRSASAASRNVVDDADD